MSRAKCSFIFWTSGTNSVLWRIQKSLFDQTEKKSDCSPGPAFAWRCFETKMRYSGSLPQQKLLTGGRPIVRSYRSHYSTGPFCQRPVEDLELAMRKRMRRSAGNASGRRRMDHGTSTVRPICRCSCC